MTKSRILSKVASGVVDNAAVVAVVFGAAAVVAVVFVVVVAVLAGAMAGVMVALFAARPWGDGRSRNTRAPIDASTTMAANADRDDVRRGDR